MLIGKIANRSNMGEKSITEKKNIYDLSRGRFKKDMKCMSREKEKINYV